MYVDNTEYEQLSGASHCQLVIEGLDSSTPHHLAVQSLAAGGYTSPRAELIFEGLVKGQGQIKENQGRLDTDLSSVLNSIQYKRGHKRTVCGYFSVFF